MRGIDEAESMRNFLDAEAPLKQISRRDLNPPFLEETLGGDSELLDENAAPMAEA